MEGGMGVGEGGREGGGMGLHDRKGTYDGGFKRSRDHHYCCCVNGVALSLSVSHTGKKD